MDEFSLEEKYFYFKRLTYLMPHEVALAMYGFDYDTSESELNPEQLKLVHKLRSAITRNIQLLDEYKDVSAKKKIEANIVLIAAYTFQRDNITPVEVRERIECALQNEAKKKNWDVTFRMLGGDELYAAGKRIRSNGRGLYRKEDESENDWKLIYILIELLSKHGKVNYTDLSVIYNDMTLLCGERGISLDGIKKATFYKKIKIAKDKIKHGV